MRNLRNGLFVVFFGFGVLGCASVPATDGRGRALSYGHGLVVALRDDYVVVEREEGLSMAKGELLELRLAEPGSMEGLKVGDHISFSYVSEGFEMDLVDAKKAFRPAPQGNLGQRGGGHGGH